MAKKSDPAKLQPNQLPDPVHHAARKRAVLAQQTTWHRDKDEQTKTGELPILALLLTKHTGCWLWLTGSSAEMLITQLLALPHGYHMDHLQLLQNTCPKAGHWVSSPVQMRILKCYRKHKRRV